MVQYEQHRCQQLRSQATPFNVQPAFRAIEQVLRELTTLQNKYMLNINLSELDPFFRVLLKVKFKTRGRAKLHALVEELRQYNDSIERRLAIPVGHQNPLQGPMPLWPPPVSGLF